MYDYRKMTPEERKAIVESRLKRGFPTHEPPHILHGEGDFLITAAFFEHKPVFDTPEHLTWISQEMLPGIRSDRIEIHAWVFLPNHYHLLVQVYDLSDVRDALRKLHSRTATAMNKKQGCKGRKVWFRFTDRQMRNKHHFYASMNYIHWNPVKHKYVDLEEEWPWSSYHDYIGKKGTDWISDLVRTYPILDYGKGWDDL